ncbi:MAG: S8 family serine peptidase [Planctomycetota bacterium]|nr:S8 family serine peptidase [Planctomycetota bacterium]
MSQTRAPRASIGVQAPHIRAGIVALLLAAGSALAQSAQPEPNRHWVLLPAKLADAPEPTRREAILALAASANPDQVRRRELRRETPGLFGTVFDERDLPLDPARVAAIESTGARVHQRSRWLNAVSVEASPAQLEAIRAMGLTTEPVRRGRAVQALEVQDDPWGADGEDGTGEFGARENYGRSAGQIAQIDLARVHDAGFTGAGVIIGVLDTGFVTTHAAFNNPAKPLRVIASFDFVKNDANVGIQAGDNSGQHHHGTFILGTLAAYLPGELVGTAPDARYILAKTEDVAGEYPAEEDNYVAGLEFVESLGADIATSSLGYIDWYTQAQLNGITAVTSRAVNIATSNGLICVTAAGNEGNDGDRTTSHLIAPADALKVITVGAVNISGTVTSFSSDGPTADGRVKPELLALGQQTATVSPTSNTGYAAVNGTSLSTPLVAGALACLLQARPTWTVDGARNVVFHTAEYFRLNGFTQPIFVKGYGLMGAHLALVSDCNGNGALDTADLASGAGTDVNANGTLDSCECLADFDGSGFPDSDDFSAFVAAFSGAGPGDADLDRSGFVDSDDFIAFVTVFSRGC